MTLRRLAMAGGILGGGGLVLLVWAPHLLWGAALVAIALALPLAALAAIFRPPNEASLCPACRDEGLVRLTDGRSGKRCPACREEFLEEEKNGG